MTFLLNFIDVFSGPGGLSLGFQNTRKYKPLLAIDNNENAITTYRKNFHVDVLKKNVSDIEISDLKKYDDLVDVLIAGPSCRPFTRLNNGSTKWNSKDLHYHYLNEGEHPDWYHLSQIINYLKPKAVVIENVLGVKSQQNVINQYLNRIGKRRYSSIVHVLNAKDFGVPQNRKRKFIISIKKKGAKLEDIPIIEEYKEKCTVEQAIKNLPILTNDDDIEKNVEYIHSKESSYTKKLRNNCNTVSDHFVHSVHEVMVDRFKYIPQGFNLKQAWQEGYIPEDIIRKEYYQGTRLRKFSDDSLKNMYSNIYRRLKWNDVSCTITHVRKSVLIHPLQNRLLSIREAARLQSFPDNFYFHGSKNSKYQQIADAVPPFLAQAVANYILKIFQNEF